MGVVAADHPHVQGDGCADAGGAVATSHGVNDTHTSVRARLRIGFLPRDPRGHDLGPPTRRWFSVALAA